MGDTRYKFCSTLNEHHFQDLYNLYQGEWWSLGRSLEEIKLVIEHSDIIFAICDPVTDRLIAFARVLTDKVFKALIFDVIVAPDRRTEGLGRLLIDSIIRHPELKIVKHLELYCLPELIPFYKKWGFFTDVAGVTFMRRNSL